MYNLPSVSQKRLSIIMFWDSIVSLKKEHLGTTKTILRWQIKIFHLAVSFFVFFFQLQVSWRRGCSMIHNDFFLFFNYRTCKTMMFLPRVRYTNILTSRHYVDRWLRSQIQAHGRRPRQPETASRTTGFHKTRQTCNWSVCDEQRSQYLLKNRTM